MSSRHNFTLLLFYPRTLSPVSHGVGFKPIYYIFSIRVQIGTRPYGEKDVSLWREGRRPYEGVDVRIFRLFASDWETRL